MPDNESRGDQTFCICTYGGPRLDEQVAILRRTGLPDDGMKRATDPLHSYVLSLEDEFRCAGSRRHGLGEPDAGGTR